jgi:ketosteroid isomerase-like protein
MRRLSLQALSVLLLIGCVVALTSSVALAGDHDAATKALIALDNDWSNAAVARDVDRVASFYAEDAHVYPPNEPLVVGRAAAKEAWGKMLADPGVKLSWTTVSAGAEGHTGWTAGTYEMSYPGADGKTVTEHGKYLCVWRKGADGKWKAIHDMWNSDSK